MYERKKLFCDLDDTYLDTEPYLRSVCKANGLLTLKGICIYDMRYTPMYRDIIKEVIKDYSVIPTKVGAEECMKVLETEYDIIFVSSYLEEYEAEAKRSLAKGLGKPIILININDSTSEIGDKSVVNMSGGVFIDDILAHLVKSNASKRILMLNKYQSDLENICKGVWTPNDLVVSDWYSVTDELMKGDEDDNLRKCICERVSECCKQHGV